MRRHAALLLSIPLALALPLLGCGSGDGAPSTTAGPGAPVTLERSGAATLRPGQDLVVTLPANATTGYAWTLTTAPDPKVLSVATVADYRPTPTSAPVAGSGGTATSRFRAVNPGSTTLTLSYRRSFEPNAPDNDTVTVTVTVR